MLNWLRRDKKEAPGLPAPRTPEDLAAEASCQPKGSRARCFNRAGDAAAEAGNSRVAKHCYGRAIDDHLESGQYDAAVAMCRKLLTYDPTVVRAHCTLAFIATGKGMLADAKMEILNYTLAAKRSKTETFAIPRLVLMGRATADPQIKLCLAESLVILGDGRAAEALRAQASQPKRPGGDASAAASGRWERLLRIAVLSSDEVWARVYLADDEIAAGRPALRDLPLAATG